MYKLRGFVLTEEKMAREQRNMTVEVYKEDGEWKIRLLVEYGIVGEPEFIKADYVTYDQLQKKGFTFDPSIPFGDNIQPLKIAAKAILKL